MEFRRVLFRSRLVGTEFIDDAGKPVMDGDEPLGERVALVRLDRAAGEIDQPVARAGYQPPAGAAQARIDAEDANRLVHRAPKIAPRATPIPLLHRGSPPAGG